VSPVTRKNVRSHLGDGTGQPHGPGGSRTGSAISVSSDSRSSASSLPHLLLPAGGGCLARVAAAVRRQARCGTLLLAPRRVGALVVVFADSFLDADAFVHGLVLTAGGRGGEWESDEQRRGEQATSATGKGKRRLHGGGPLELVEHRVGGAAESW
jgi:hypothetical protein